MPKVSYGTGAGSIYAREAPSQRPRARSFHAVNGSTFRERAHSSTAAVALKQMCCAKQRIGSHHVVLFVGDSQLQAVFHHLCDQVKRPACDSHLVFIVAAGKWARHYPSYHKASVALARLQPSMNPTAVVSNFAAPHLLQVHPVRPWFDADSNVLKPKCNARSSNPALRPLPVANPVLQPS